MLTQDENMGYQEFFKKLKERVSEEQCHPYYNQYKSQIRIDSPKHLFCPITFLAYTETHQIFGTEAWVSAANTIHMDKDLAHYIVEASDSAVVLPKREQKVNEYRRLLIETLGLPPSIGSNLGHQPYTEATE